MDRYYLFNTAPGTGMGFGTSIGKGSCAWDALRDACPQYFITGYEVKKSVLVEITKYKDLGPAKPVLDMHQLANMGGPSSWERLFDPGDEVVKVGADGLTADKHDAAVRLIVSGMAADRIAGVLGLRLAQVNAIAVHVRNGDYDHSREERKRRIEECFANLGRTMNLYFLFLEGRLERAAGPDPVVAAQLVFGDKWPYAYWKPFSGLWPLNGEEEAAVIGSRGWFWISDGTSRKLPTEPPSGAAAPVSGGAFQYAVRHTIFPSEVRFAMANCSQQASKVLFPSVINLKVLEYKVCPILTADPKVMRDWRIDAGGDDSGWRTVDSDPMNRTGTGTTSRKAKVVATADEFPDVTREALHRLIESGMRSRDIAAALGLTTQQVAAVRAHGTMGTYNGSPDAVRRQVEKHFKKLGY